MPDMTGKPFATNPPKIVEMPGLPEFFCELLIVKDFDETMRVFLCRKDGGAEVEATALVHIPKSGFLTSLNWAATQFLFRKH